MCNVLSVKTNLSTGQIKSNQQLLLQLEHDKIQQRTEIEKQIATEKIRYVMEAYRQCYCMWKRIERQTHLKLAHDLTSHFAHLCSALKVKTLRICLS